MITLPQLREHMRNQLDEERKVKSVQVAGVSIEDALKQASLELGVPVKGLEYEVVQRGNRGMMGVGKREWILLAYEAVGESAAANIDEVDMAGIVLEAEKPPEPVDRAGEVFVRLTREGAFLKVTKPVGGGAKAAERTALEKLSLRGVHNYDAGQVAKVVKHADSEYIRVGEFEYNPANQSALAVEITDQDMKAYMTVSQPGPGGQDLSFDEIESILKSNSVVHGAKNDVIEGFIDYPHYNEKILIAAGTQPVDGQDARVIYNFNIDHSEIKLKEKNGRIDFKELNLVENVEAGQLLAKKTPPEKGKPGTTVLGHITPAKDGRDVTIDIGKNVKLSDDGSNVISTINGQVILTAGKINVEPVHTVPGDVNFKTGNILFLGTVVVRGNVEDGFSVKAAGNIEIMGSVGKCVLDAEGKVIVHQGIMGKNGGHVRAGTNVAAKFIEHARVEAEENVLVSDGIIHSFVDANKRIVCQGRRASVVGGRLRAAEEINAKAFGSVAGTETILEVGYDPKRKEQLAQATTKKSELEKQLEEMERNIKTLENLKKIQKKFPEDKQKNLTELNDRRSELLQELDQLNKEISAINNYLSSLKVKGKVSASDRVFPGVKIFIKNESLVVRNEFKKVTFYLEGTEVRMTKYEPSELEVARRV